MRLLNKYFILLLIISSSCDAQIEKILHVISNLKKNLHSKVIVSKLEGGLTNVNYKVQLDDDTFFVRCGLSQNYLLGASIESEWQCATITSSVDLSPKTIKYFPEEKILITEFIENKKKIDLLEDETMQNFCYLIRTLHRLPCKFPKVFCPFEIIDMYILNINSLNVVLPEKFVNEILPFIEETKKSVKKTDQLVPCHLDLHKKNILDDGTRLWIIDWEYAAMADPFFDIAVCASTDFFTDDQMERLLNVYLERRPFQEEMDHFYIMRILADARWALWCYLQDKISPLRLPFKLFGDQYITECLNRIEKCAAVF